jgi:hypothetical protein
MSFPLLVFDQFPADQRVILVDTAFYRGKGYYSHKQNTVNMDNKPDRQGRFSIKNSQGEPWLLAR